MLIKLLGGIYYFFFFVGNATSLHEVLPAKSMIVMISKFEVVLLTLDFILNISFVLINDLNSSD